MIIGVPKEIKELENRVALTPYGVDELVRAGHKVLVEKNAGLGSGFTNEEYSKLGAEIIDNQSKLWEDSELILKVKEPQASEYGYLREGLIIFAYFHLANEPELTIALKESGTIAIAYETVELNGELPLLAPMSEIAGRMAVQEGAVYLDKTRGGKGKLIDGVPGVESAHVVIVGAGRVGAGAVKKARGLGAKVTVLNRSINKLRYLEEVYPGIETLHSNNYNLARSVKTADLVIGAVLVPGSRAPKLITEEMVKEMEPGSVILDVAVDQGAIVETIDKPTTLKEPIFVKHGVLHYAVSNIPGAVPQTATLALTNVTLPYTMEIANKGWENALKENPALAKGANIVKGKITYKGIADAFNMEYVNIEDILNYNTYGKIISI